MAARPHNPYAALKTIFHEPNRMAIVAALSCTADGLTFGELKQECDLTNGNLNRHLKTLEEADIISITKSFVNAKPRTTVCLSDLGRESFLAYLQALEEALHKAAESVAAVESSARPHMGLAQGIRPVDAM